MKAKLSHFFTSKAEIQVMSGYFCFPLGCSGFIGMSSHSACPDKLVKVTNNPPRKQEVVCLLDLFSYQQ